MTARPGQVSEMQEAAENMTNFMTDLGRSLTCDICVRPLYEPFTSACGHTHCYSCLYSWFRSCGHDKTCPDCRALVTAAPAPAYLIRELTHKLTSKVEFLPEGETVEQHLYQRAEEAANVELHKTNTDVLNGGLFRGMFRSLNRMNPLRDLEDGVTRCPLCQWELQDDSCFRCGYMDFGSENDSLIGERYLAGDDGLSSIESDNSSQLTSLSDIVARNRQHDDHDGGGYDTDDSMDSFLDDDEDSELDDRSGHDSSEEGEEEDVDAVGETRRNIHTDETSDNVAMRTDYISDEDSDEVHYLGGLSDDDSEADPIDAPRGGAYTSDEDIGDEAGSILSFSSSSTATVTTAQASRSARRTRVVSTDAEDETNEYGADTERNHTKASNGIIDSDDELSDEDVGPVRPLRRAQPGRATRNLG